MNEREKVTEKLRKKEQEIASLEEKIKTAKVYVQALRDIQKMLGSEVDQDTDSEATLRRGSAVDQARHVIMKKGAPVHIDEILQAVGKQSTRENKASLTSSLAAYVRRGEIFTRPAPNTFGLVELGHELEHEQINEPPVDFGRSRSEPVTIDDDEIPF